MANRWGNNGNSDRLYFLGAPKLLQMVIAAMKLKDACSLEEKLWPTYYSILKSRDVTLPTKVHLFKAMIFPLVMYGCDSWTIKKAEHWRIDAFELWCWRRLLRVPWTAWRSNQFSSVQLLSRVWLSATPWIAALQASLSITISRSSPRLMFIKSMMPSSHLILCRPHLLLPPIPPSIRVFSSESTLYMRWPK